MLREELQFWTQGSLAIIVTNYSPASVYLLITFANNLDPAQTRKIVSEYDQELQQSQTADNPVAARGRAAQPSRDTRKTN